MDSVRVVRVKRRRDESPDRILKVRGFEREKGEKRRKLLDEFATSFNLDDTPYPESDAPSDAIPTCEDIGGHEWERIAFHVGTLETPSMMRSLAYVFEKSTDEQECSSKKPLIQVADFDRGKDIRARTRAGEGTGEGEEFVYDVYMVQNGVQNGVKGGVEGGVKGGKVEMEKEEEEEEKWTTRVFINGVEPFDLMNPDIPSYGSMSSITHSVLPTMYYVLCTMYYVLPCTHDDHESHI
jgi:hypothetical protein